MDYTLFSEGLTIKYCVNCGKAWSECACRRLSIEDLYSESDRQLLGVGGAGQQREGHNQDVDTVGLGIGPSVMEVNAGSSGVNLFNRPVTSVGQTTGYTNLHALSDAVIKETPWDLQRMMERPNLSSSFVWTSTSPEHLLQLNVPQDLLTTKILKSPFNSFEYWRGDIVLRIQVAGAPLYQGILAVSFIPMIFDREIDAFKGNLPSLTINPTVYLFANSNTIAELRIPYKHIQSYLLTAPGQNISSNLGVVMIYALGSLTAVDPKTASVNVSIFSIFENSEFKVPRISSQITLVEKQRDRLRLRTEWDDDLVSESNTITINNSNAQNGGGGSPSGRTESSNTSRNSSGKEHKTSAAGLLQGGGTKDLVPGLLKTAASFAKGMISQGTNNDMLGMIKDAASKAMPVNFLGDAMGYFTGLLGLDNPTIPVNDPSVVIRACGPMNYSVGPEYVEKMTVYPSSMNQVTDENFGTIVDEMDFNYLKKRYSYLGSFEQQKTDTPSTLLYTVPIHPMPFTNPKVVGQTLQSGNVVPLLSYLGLPFRYWTGSLVYKIQVSASSMHTSKIFVAFNYGLYGDPKDLFDATSQYGVAYEIAQGSNEFEFRVPFVSVTPYKLTCNGQMDSSMSLGNLHVVVLNSLVAPDSVAPYISFNIFLAGGPDFSYEVLSSCNPVCPLWISGATSKQHYIEMGDQKSVPSLQEGYRRARAKRGLSRKRVNPEIVSDLFAESQTGYPLGSNNNTTTAPTNVASTITDSAEEVEVVAPPSRNITVDEHFGVTLGSLRDLMKKYQYCDSKTPLSFTSGEAGTTDPDKTTCLWTDFVPSAYLSPTNLTAVGFAPKLNIPLHRTAGIITWASSLYRMWRGPLRYKLVVNGLTPNQVVRAVWHPYYTIDRTDEGERVFAASANQILGFGGQPTFTSDENLLTGCNLFPNVMLMTASPLTILEGEIPFTTRYQSLLTGRGYVETTSYEECFVGNLCVYITPVVAIKQSISVDFYMAIGDETRFGALYCVPLVYVNGEVKVNASGTYTTSGPVYPSTYTI